MLDTMSAKGTWHGNGVSAADIQVSNVLIVENDLPHTETLARGLERHGHRVNCVATGDEALRAHEDASIVLMDLELPDLDGLEVCRGIRSISDVPLIALTARETELDLILGFQAGVDDYLVKPYRFRELLARMNAVSRRAQHSSHPADRVITHGPLHIEVPARQVYLDGRPISMTPKEFDLLHLLASSPSCVLARKQIRRRVWGDCWSRRTLDTHVSSVRSKLGSADWIITVRGVGFRLGYDIASRTMNDRSLVRAST